MSNSRIPESASDAASFPAVATDPFRPVPALAEVSSNSSESKIEMRQANR